MKQKKSKKRSKIFRDKKFSFFSSSRGGGGGERGRERRRRIFARFRAFARANEMRVRRCCYYRVLLLLKLAVVLFLCADYESNEGKATLFVSGAKPSPRGGGKGGKGKGKDDIIGLEQLRTKLSIAESAIAKVTQELVARGEDIGEKKKMMMKGGGESKRKRRRRKRRRRQTTTKKLNTFPIGDR